MAPQETLAGSLKYEGIRKAILFIAYALTGRHPKGFWRLAA